MVWIGIAIGIIFTSCFGMALLVIVSKQKTNNVPDALKEFWQEKLSLQRTSTSAIESMSRIINFHVSVQNSKVKRILLVGKETGAEDGWNEWHDVEIQPTTNNEGVMVIHVKAKD